MKKKLLILCFLLIGLSILLLPFSLLADSTNPLTGNYFGTTTITSPAALGTIDLAFYLDVTGSTFQSNTSYIKLDKTLLFPPAAPGRSTGPGVSGTISPSSFNLVSDEFYSLVSILYKEDKSVKRQILLTGTSVTNGGNSLTGTYTEKITGMSKEIITVTGSFVLVKPVVISSASIKPNADGCIDLTAIRTGGNDPNVLEFSDISYALHLYYNSTLQPNICNSVTVTKDQIIRDALNEYYATQK